MVQLLDPAVKPQDDAGGGLWMTQLVVLVGC